MNRSNQQGSWINTLSYDAVIEELRKRELSEAGTASEKRQRLARWFAHMRNPAIAPATPRIGPETGAIPRDSGVGVTGRISDPQGAAALSLNHSRSVAVDIELGAEATGLQGQGNFPPPLEMPILPRDQPNQANNANFVFRVPNSQRLRLTPSYRIRPVKVARIPSRRIRTPSDNIHRRGPRSKTPLAETQRVTRPPSTT